MRHLFTILVIIFGLQSAVLPRALTKAKREAKRRQFIDLAGIDVQGLVDRPQTLYILKKSEIDFKNNIAEYDYMSAIIDPTYKEPF